jgi:hypothetical protein
MQTLELNKMGLAPITDIEMQEHNGGFLPLLIVGCLLLAGCVQTNQNNGAGTQINSQTNAQNTGDSSTIRNHGTLKVSPK